jgi:hypothetical protein
MQDFLESARRAAGGALERAAWEADRMRRANERQHEIELSRRERQALVEQLAGVLLDQERRGQLPAGPLKTLAERLRALDDDINRGLAEVQTIRGEHYVPGSVTVNVQRKDATGPAHGGANGAGGASERCPSCGRPVRGDAAYCSACGARLK